MKVPDSLAPRLERVPDADVTVDGDGTHVHDGRRAQRHVQNLPEVADYESKRPVTWKVHIFAIMAA